MVVSPAPRRGVKCQKEALSPVGAALTAKSSPKQHSHDYPGIEGKLRLRSAHPCSMKNEGPGIIGL